MHLSLSCLLLATRRVLNQSESCKHAFPGTARGTSGDGHFLEMLANMGVRHKAEIRTRSEIKIHEWRKATGDAVANKILTFLPNAYRYLFVTRIAP